MDVQTAAVSVGGINVSQMIDDARLSRFQLTVFALCALTIMIDGFDVQSISYVAPVLTDAFQVNRAMLGPIFSAGLVGTVLGALLIAPPADRIGRKVALILCVALFGLSSLATAGVTSLEQLMVIRLIGGLGLGVATPVAVALCAGDSPKRNRGAIIIIVYLWYSVGAPGGGLVIAYLLTAFCWRLG